jgi:hypothetical protein
MVMADIDLYTLLESYAKKTHSPYVDIKVFIQYVEKNARRLAANFPEWLPWSNHTEEKIWETLPNLVKEEKCKIITNIKGSQIFLSTFYVNLIRQAYASGESSEIPFPDEKTLKLAIAQDQVRTLYIESDLTAYLDNPQDTILPIIKFFFPRDIPHMIILSELIPKRMPEMSILKVQKYLWIQGNKEHIRSKMIARFQGREDYLRDMINYIMTQPMNCLADIESGGDLSFLFWSFFCNLVKKEVHLKNELTSRDVAILQAIHVLEILNNYHKSRVVRTKDRETALKNLSLAFDKPPYLYNLSTIMKFSDTMGIPLLGKYSQEDLETFLREKITDHKENELPELLIVNNLIGEQFFVKKTVLLPLCSRLLADARPLVKTTVSERWFKLLKAYEREPAMDKDEEFEAMLNRMIKKTAPTLASLLKDNKVAVVYHELDKDSTLADPSKLFDMRGKLLPLSDLLMLNRRALLIDTRMLLPFWYSITILIRIITFFKNLGKKRVAEEDQDEGEYPELGHSGNENAHSPLQELTSEFIPPGKTLAEVLAEQEARWNTRINSQTRKDLETDVNSLIFDRMRQLMRLPKKPKITREFLDHIASAFVTESTALQKLGSREAIILYIKLYILYLLINKKI